jgi:hypothetical protein
MRPGPFIEDARLPCNGSESANQFPGCSLTHAEDALSDTITHLHTLRNSQLRRDLFDGHPEIADLYSKQIEWLLRRLEKTDHTLRRSEQPSAG